MTTKAYYTEDSADVLTGGEWVNHRGVQRWVPQPPPKPVTLKVVPKPRVVNTLIACPSCLATLVEFCKDKSGSEITRPHIVRLVRRRCVCGMTVPKHRRFCRYCRAEMRAEARDAVRQEGAA